jgi:hypothetical protein
MIPAAIKVTVYLVGLVNFYHIENASDRNVYLLKTTSGVVYQGVALVEHHPLVEIQGLKGGEAACKKRGASWNGLACVVKNLPGKTAIELPKSTTELHIIEQRFNLVPTLAGQCPGATMKPTALTEYAAVVTPTSGTLDLCTYKGGLVTYLGLDNASGDLVIGGKHFPLTDGARVYVSNSPMEPHGGPANSGAHFFWYYTILNLPAGGTCNKVPAVRFFGPECTRFEPTYHDSFPAIASSEFCGPVH